MCSNIIHCIAVTVETDTVVVLNSLLYAQYTFMIEADAKFLHSCPLMVEADAEFLHSRPLMVEADAEFLHSRPLIVEADAEFLNSRPPMVKQTLSPYVYIFSLLHFIS